MSPKKVARPLDLYIRVSDTKGRSGESFQSPKEQEERCRAALASRGLEAGQVFKELDVSGKSMDRPQFRKVLERIEAGNSGGVVVAKIDRFGRTVVGALEAMQKIDAAGGVVITAEGDFDTSTAVGELVLGMMLQLAQFELRRISEQWVSSKARAVAAGKHVTHFVPPGYRSEDSRLTPHPKHGATITRAYELAAQGVAPADIGRFLTEQGLPSGIDKENPEGKPTVWRSSRIGRLLANRVYLGEARANDSIVKRDAHAPLTDEATWLRAQRKPTAQPLATSTALLTGIVRCASCRHSMSHQKASKHAVATYRCSRTSSGTSCPHPSTISAEKLERIVLDAWVARVASKPDNPKASPDDTAALARLEDAKKALSEVESLRGELRPAAYAQALDSALADVEAAQEAVASVGAWDERDAAQLANAVLPMIAEYEDEETGKRTPIPFDEEGLRAAREALAREIAAVFIRPAARRSKSLPISDRVKIVWAGEEELELPKRGTRSELPPYTWEAA